MQRDLSDLVVFSHLRWEFVTQRPQHLLSRMARDRKVLFVEEPIGFEENDRGTAHTYSAGDNITILQPRIGWDNLMEDLTPIVTQYLQRLGIEQPALWFYSAAFHGMSETIPHSLIIYDCMDELSAFKGASPLLIEQERRLLEKADVVFTGGKSLYEAKSKLCSNVHCYPSSVDRAHFAQALEERTQVPDDIRNLKHPVVGYYGVIDERIDLDLLRNVARENPDVSFVMIGPVVKISEQDLPQADNLHYLGGKPYADLPGYLRAFDIAMMPFALNESTRFISPTKTPEYLAAHKPVISTAIQDVVRDYSHVIPIVRDSTEFSAALRAFLAETGQQRQQRLAEYETILAAASWDKTVEGMKTDIRQALTATPA